MFSANCKGVQQKAKKNKLRCIISFESDENDIAQITFHFISNFVDSHF